jgi:HAE1 family hydrophobic/amphiphilic exporter-1
MSLIRGAINRPVTVSMAMAATMLFGVVSLDRLAVNLLPDISYPSLTVQTDYEDAAPEEIESLVTRPIEESVGVIPGLTRLASVSRSGQSEVVLEFGWGTNMDLAAMETREKLDLVNLPRDVKRPVILRFDPSNDPIMRLQLSGKEMSLARLRYAAEKELKKNLESTDGVAAIKVIGGLEEQIRIEIDEKRLAELRVPITEVTQVLAQENLNQASGSLYDQDANYLVRILNQFKTVE